MFMEGPLTDEDVQWLIRMAGKSINHDQTLWGKLDEIHESVEAQKEQSLKMIVEVMDGMHDAQAEVKTLKDQEAVAIGELEISKDRREHFEQLCKYLQRESAEWRRVHEGLIEHNARLSQDAERYVKLRDLITCGFGEELVGGTHGHSDVDEFVDNFNPEEYQ
jgi:hypothetical protein